MFVCNFCEKAVDDPVMVTLPGYRNRNTKGEQVGPPTPPPAPIHLHDECVDEWNATAKQIKRGSS